MYVAVILPDCLNDMCKHISDVISALIWGDHHQFLLDAYLEYVKNSQYNLLICQLMLQMFNWIKVW